MNELLKHPEWLVWILQFVVIELPALYNAKRGDTWSEVLRYVFGFSQRAANGDIKQMQSTGMKLRRGSFYALSAWFVYHIAWQ